MVRLRLRVTSRFAAVPDLTNWFQVMGKLTSFVAAGIVVLIAVILLPEGNVSPLFEYDFDEISLEVPAFDANELADEVSALVKLNTISDPAEPYNLPAKSQENINQAHKLLRKFYPTLFSSVTAEIIDGFSLLLRLPGSEPSLRPALVMCHLDVVPVEEGTESHWGKRDGCEECGPFSGAQWGGYVWGRGSLDMKSTCVTFLHAAEKLLSRKQGFNPHRTIYLAIGHDEETRGNGQVAIVDHLHNQGIQLEAVLDEGNPTLAAGSTALNRDYDLAMPGLAEKGYLNIQLSFNTTEAGHAAMPPLQGTPITIIAEAIRRIHHATPWPTIGRPVTDMLQAVAPVLPQPVRFLLSRRGMLAPLVSYAFTFQHKTAALVRTTSAATRFHAGVKENVIPQSASALVNFRILPGDTIDTVVKRCAAAVNDPRVTLHVMPGAAEVLEFYTCICKCAVNDRKRSRQIAGGYNVETFL